jgi:16S rRNA processing protein RimM
VEAGPLTIASMRWHSGRLLIRFDGVADRNAAEELQGILLVADSESSRGGDEDDFWDHDLVGLTAELSDGTVIGTVSDVLHPPGPVVLVLDRGNATEALVPFVSEIVPSVELSRGRLVVDPPEGLLDLGDS